MANRYGIRVFLVLDLGEIELPNHDAAIDNLNWSDPRLRIARVN